MNSMEFDPGSSFGNFNHSTEWSREDRMLDVLRDSCPGVVEATQQLQESLNTALELGEGFNPDHVRQIAAVTRQLISSIHDMPNRDYRQLVGILNLVRNKESDLTFADGIAGLENAGCSPTTSQALSHLGVIRGHREKMSDCRHQNKAEIDREFAVDAMLLLRSVYTLGINMKTPDWGQIQGEIITPDHDPVFYDATQPLSLRRVLLPTADAQLDTVVGLAPRRRESNVVDQIVVRPMKENSERSELIYLSPEGERVEFGSISEAESMVIGRTLWVQHLFGLRRADNKLLCGVEAGGSIENQHYSRGGLQVLRLNGIWIFNRGVVNHFEVRGFDSAGELISDFTGDSFSDARGTIWFGESRTFRPPPQDDQDSSMS